MPEFYELVKSIIEKSGCTHVFTHNLHGEYGHPDHRILFHAVLCCRKPMLITDMSIDANWIPKQASMYENLFDRPWHSSHTVDADFYAECEAIYRKHGCWTWSKPPIEFCSVMELNPHGWQWA